ncbi:hypothetical protein AJ88_08775 [Mesorhizobium amorphae CCBAU 01583]|nr:hypothetical protein AJ88_08775 [Mesorhizobium amorphae CCBAU 01583]
MLSGTNFLTGALPTGSDFPDVVWLTETGAPLSEADWHDPRRHRLVMLLAGGGASDGRLAVIVNGDRRQSMFTLPGREGFHWVPAIEAPTGDADIARPLSGRTVIFMTERKAGQARAKKDL